MFATQTSRNLSIAPGATLHFTNHDRQRLSVRTVDGYVWLTRDGDIKDYLLRAGDAISLCAGDHVWLTLGSAERAGSLTLESLEAPRPFWSSLAALFSGRAARPCKATVTSPFAAPNDGCACL